jgi:hypothetical protein
MQGAADTELPNQHPGTPPLHPLRRPITFWTEEKLEDLQFVGAKQI